MIAVGLGHALFAIQALRQQLLGGDLQAAQLQGEQALVLIEGGGEGGKKAIKVHGNPGGR
ncbi:hypothetical protein ABH313_07865 [Chromobacterium vaccinii]|uniref:hypothetical protein n=1 Tax=Chromobacterium vaccinii TaxID=1108595 RepID=UPI00325FE9D9